MSGYERVETFNIEEGSENGGNSSFKGRCPTCGSEKRNDQSWSGSIKKNRSLVVYLIFAIAVVSVVVLFASPIFHNRKQDDAQNSQHMKPAYKSVEAEEYYQNHEHEEESEVSHETVQIDVEPPRCKSTMTTVACNITDQDAAKHVSSYTPALGAIEYYTQDIGYDFGLTSKYRGPPNEEREKAWQELYYHQSILIPTKAMPSLNRTNLDQYQKADADKGDGYLAWTEMHRQLGCLNVIRQYTWFLTDGYSPGRVPQELRWPPSKNRDQVDHCIEGLRQSIMCYGDMTPVLVTKERNPTGWRNDFNVHHTCRNFTKLQNWTITHGAENWGKEQGHHHIVSGPWEKGAA